MSRGRRIFIVAGEASGDLLGSQLMRAINDLSKEPMTYSGVGGRNMIGAGLYPVFPMSDIALMGAAEIIPRLRNIFRRMNATANVVQRLRPDLVVLIDSPEFNLRLAKRIRRRCPGIPITLYVAPQVWASRPGRAKKMPKFVDHIFALLPFEKAFFEGAGIPCTVVGHPVIERKRLMTGGAEFRKAHGVSAEAPLLCLLPGSRLNEVKRLLPLFAEVVQSLKRDFPVLRLVLPIVPHVVDLVAAQVADWQDPPILVNGEAEKYAAFDASDVALAASGTVALELALARIPSVIAYRVDPVTAFVARRIVTAKYANLVNLIVDHPAVPELIQQDCRVDAMVEHVKTLFKSDTARDAQLQYVDEAVEALGLDGDAPSRRAAAAVLEAID